MNWDNLYRIGNAIWCRTYPSAGYVITYEYGHRLHVYDEFLNHVDTVDIEYPSLNFIDFEGARAGIASHYETRAEEYITKKRQESNRTLHEYQ